MPNSVTICGVVFTDPKILAIHAKAIAESFVVFPILNDYVAREECVMWGYKAERYERESFWKLQGDILGSIAGEC